MKNLIRLTVTTGVILLLAISLTSLASAHGSDQSTGDSNNQDHTMMDNHSMRDVSDHMSIEGTISVEEAIILNLNVSPNEEMEDMMNDHMGSGGHMDDQSMMEEYMNEITVEFYALVEFEDATGNGYSSDDTQVSNFSLSDETLNQPESDNEQFTIVSNDNSTFAMEVDLKFDDALFHGFKWSVEINYKFQSNSSDLALLHRLSTTGGSMMDQHQMTHGNMHQGSHMQYSENHMVDNNEHLPMSFGWATTAVVDDVEQSIVATSEDEAFALAIPQGQSIYYDPEISADVEDIRTVDGQLSDLYDSIQDFIDTINSPTLIGIILGFSSLAVLTIVALYKRRN